MQLQGAVQSWFICHLIFIFFIALRRLTTMSRPEMNIDLHPVFCHCWAMEMMCCLQWSVITLYILKPSSMVIVVHVYLVCDWERPVTAPCLTEVQRCDQSYFLPHRFSLRTSITSTKWLHTAALLSRGPFTWLSSGVKWSMRLASSAMTPRVPSYCVIQIASGSTLLTHIYDSCLYNACSYSWA